MKKLSLGDRMKANYEVRTRQYLTRRTPTIIRLDGKAFHTYTKGLERPFDEGLMEDMAETTKFLCKEIQGVKCGYTQSDEITLLLTDYDTFETQAWFDYQVQKMCSVAASIATAKFNQLRLKREIGDSVKNTTDDLSILQDLYNTPQRLAFFDARVFQIPEHEEVVNCFIWRQRDAIKNSIQMLAQSLYSSKELHKKNDSEQLLMCAKKGNRWDLLSIQKQRGTFICKIEVTLETPYVSEDKMQQTYTRNKWESVDTPLFGEDRNSILNLLNHEKKSSSNS